MPTKRMLIDASHPEETRVVVIDGTRLEEYDVEVASRRQIKGNIYLAKVTRVEPSLQAAFVDYGGNRHGFLAFNEIHPDYYQIPVADRERLLAEEAALREAENEPEEQQEEGEVQEVGGDDEEELEPRQVRLSRDYKIQEVIKRRQIMLVQVAKEERGSKGAALTTFLSLAGRYCVLMPNSARGGGISRKITNVADRKRLKKILSELEVPEGMAVIVRTAGAGRSKAEIKRDCDYMIRLWNSIREVTLKSSAPTLVYEEGSLIKRSLRDLYERDIEEIIIQGEPEYKVAREFMKLFIPSHAKRVKLYENAQEPLFPAYQVEDQLDAMHQPVVQLRSGGYIVLSSTEALVSIDVNSGRATRERHIEETALRTNLEAADEVARQLRLRDLAGLVVVDFIDMENPRNQGLVERRMKDAMKGDRARTQIGRLSPFGLLELSRQRLRPSLLETSFETCPFCRGAGARRTTESTALMVLRKIEEEALKQKATEIIVSAPVAVAMYLLNQKRRALGDIEARFGLSINIVGDAGLIPPEYRIDRSKALFTRSDEEAAAPEAAEEADLEDAADGEREDGGKRGRRRRGRRRKRSDEDLPLALEAMGEPPLAAATDEAAESEAEAEGEEAAEASGEGEEGTAEKASEGPRKRRRRGKRGGRRRSRRPGEEVGGEMPAGASEAPFSSTGEDEDDAEAEGEIAAEAEPGLALASEGEGEQEPPVAAAADLPPGLDEVVAVSDEAALPVGAVEDEEEAKAEDRPEPPRKGRRSGGRRAARSRNPVDAEDAAVDAEETAVDSEEEVDLEAAAGAEAGGAAEEPVAADAEPGAASPAWVDPDGGATEDFVSPAAEVDEAPVLEHEALERGAGERQAASDAMVTEAAIAPATDLGEADLGEAGTKQTVHAGSAHPHDDDEGGTGISRGSEEPRRGWWQRMLS